MSGTGRRRPYPSPGLAMWQPEQEEATALVRELTRRAERLARDVEEGIPGAAPARDWSSEGLADRARMSRALGTASRVTVQVVRRALRLSDSRRLVPHLALSRVLNRLGRGMAKLQERAVGGAWFRWFLEEAEGVINQAASFYGVKPHHEGEGSPPG